MKDELLKNLQVMAWERAKGELNSILVTIYPDYEKEDPHREFKELEAIIKKFILEVEDNTFLG